MNLLVHTQLAVTVCFCSAGAFDEDNLAPGGFDIEVEVEQEGGGETLQLAIFY